MSKAEAQIRAMPWAQLLALKTVAGRLTIDRINEEISHRIRLAHTNQPSRSWYSDPNSARQILTNPNVAATVQEAKAARSARVNGC